MTAPAAVTDRGASLLQTDPSLGPLLGARDAAAAGHRPVLPMLAFGAGAWTPPAASRLGDGTFALVVLDGALLREPADGEARVLGPGDLLEPWTEPSTRWTACTPVRAAVIGHAFLRAVGPWPAAAGHMLRRAAHRDERAGVRVERRRSGTAEDRLGALLWHLALQWGRTEVDGIALPLTLAPVMLAKLAAVPAREATTGLRALERARTATRRADGTWLLRASGRGLGEDLAARRDDLRERAAAALARARATNEISAELMEEAAALRERAGEGRRR